VRCSPARTVAEQAATQRIFTVGNRLEGPAVLARGTRLWSRAGGQPMFGLPGDFRALAPGHSLVARSRAAGDGRELPPVVLAQLLDEPAPCAAREAARTDDARGDRAARSDRAQTG